MKKALQKCLPVFLILLSLITVDVQADSLSLPAVPEGWHSLLLDVQFNGTRFQSGNVSLFNKDGSLARYLPHLFKPISADLQQRLFMDSTENRFRRLYPRVYQQPATAYAGCSFVGLELDLDNRPETREWYITFPAERCIYRQHALLNLGVDFNQHGWLLQCQANGHFRVLMESSGVLYLSGDTVAESYKGLRTRVFNPHIDRQAAHRERGNRPVCGFGVIDWRFQGKSYQPTRLFPVVTSCEEQFVHFAQPGENLTQFLGRVKPDVTRCLLHWMQKVTGRPMRLNRDFSLRAS